MAKPGFYAFPWANGLSKTATAALWALWFLDCHPGAKLLTTAGTWSQLKEQLWREIPTWAARAKAPIVPHLARIDKTQINLAPDWAAFGRAADKGSTFEGVHGQHVAILMDEAKAIKPEIFSAVRRILRGNPGGQFWWIALSSPGSPSGPFYDVTVGDQAHRWNTLWLSAYESERVSLEQIRQDAEDLGETSPLFVSMDTGQFPREGSDTVIPLSWAQAAVNRIVSTEGPNFLGVDVARFGGDETALMGLFGRQARLRDAYTGKDTVWTSGRISELFLSDDYKAVAVDDTGVGGGVTDHLVADGKSVEAVNFGSTENLERPDRYANVKAELYFWLRAELEAGFKESENPEVGLSIEDDKKLVHQLSMQKFSFTPRRQYRIESHEELRKRQEKSPDRSDALALANYARARAGVARGITTLGNLV